MIRTLVACFALWGGGAAADVLLVNARVHTVDEALLKAEALLITDDGLIGAVGSSSDLKTAYPLADIVDLGGRMVLPGFQDAHLHALEAGMYEDFCLPPQFGDATDYRYALEECADIASGDWVLGAGVNMISLLTEVADPLALIDAIIPDRPALIIDDLGHGAWANSVALARAGLDAAGPDPQGGMFAPNLAGGVSGVVLESLSQTMLDVVFPPTEANLDRSYFSLVSALRVLAAHGVTTVSDAGGYWPRGHDEVWRMVEADGLMTVRASNALYVYPDRPMEQQIAELVARYDARPGALVRFDQVKLYVDGILSQATGALNAPYAEWLDLPPELASGFEYFRGGALNEYARRLSHAGFKLHIHTTGDRGTRLALNAIEGANAAPGPHRITHLYMIALADMPRFAALNVVADFQMASASLDREYRIFMRDMIGRREASMLPLRAMLKTNALVTLSSDWDADDLSPLHKLETVVTHAGVDLETAIRLMTLNPAKLLNHADQTGSIVVGKQADLVVLDRDLFVTPPSELGEVSVDATLLGGKPVYNPAGLF
ncbi:MAG: amidohydrolase [Pikeienuella sp.]